MKRIGVSLGDPRGIGPEVAAKALNSLSGQMDFLPIIFGDQTAFLKVLESINYHTQIDCVNFSEISNSGEDVSGRIIFVQSKGKSIEESVLDSIHQAATGCLQGILSAMVTGPIDKAKIQKVTGEKDFKGHTDYLAKISNSSEYLMMLLGDNLRVVPITTHCPIKEVSNLLSIEKISQGIRVTHRSLRDTFKIKSPCIGVCALNPHAGENGLLGSEEIEMIKPAIHQCVDQEIDVHGPFSSDTIFSQIFQKKRNFDGVICMYHDQALIPLKLLHFGEAVNITLGLPFIRTSVDHGTAYDIAGKNIANPDSMIKAIQLADQLSDFV